MNHPTTTNQEPQRSPVKARRRARLIPWLVLLGTGAAALAVLFALLSARSRAGAGLPDYSVYSDGPDGLAQASDVLRKLGWQPLAVTRPIQQTHHRGLLILVEPRRPGLQLEAVEPMSDADVDGLLAWVQQGNTLLFCAAHKSLLLEKLRVALGESEPGDVMLVARPSAVGEYTARVAGIGVESDATVSARGAVPLWSLGSKAGAVLIRHGQGRVLVVADPSLLTHRGLLREDNVVFLYNVAALDAEDGRVYFDEYHHGIRAGAGYWNYLRYHHQHWIVVHLLLLAGVAVWAVGRRLGPAVPMPVVKQADGVDYASSVARIYQKADVRSLVGDSLARHFLDAVTVYLRLRRNAGPTEILATWRSRYSKESAHELETMLNSIADMDRSAAAWLTAAQHLDAFLDRHVRQKAQRP
jgi:hypothetical protein